MHRLEILVHVFYPRYGRHPLSAILGRGNRLEPELGGFLQGLLGLQNNESIEQQLQCPRWRREELKIKKKSVINFGNSYYLESNTHIR